MVNGLVSCIVTILYHFDTRCKCYNTCTTLQTLSTVHYCPLYKTIINHPHAYHSCGEYTLDHPSPSPCLTSGNRDQPLVGERSGAAGPVSLTGLSCTVTLDPRNSNPLRSSLSEFPLEGLAEGGSDVLTIALKEAVLEGVSLPPVPLPVPLRYSSSLSLTLVRI